MGEWSISAPDPSTRLLMLSGRWGVEGAEELHRGFTQALAQAVEVGAALHVDLGDIEDGDVTFFQLLVSVAKSLGPDGPRFMNIPESIMAKAEQMGFAPRHADGIFRKGVEDVQANLDRG
ncbi:STAS domain-containing protein [Desulfonatronum sp. SC1]|uniref:STAS domain-containing protein n=1 Tax=Desulfonatronum sp. SC1 TaxID=2109626 RepID=UPI000D3152FB|nr:STAS domain-containing protein [Desulfonatronum sp. SC1]PTN38420.1 hypothetical protein C6366_02360 [Desulfonatronum sp. SC1]